MCWSASASVAMIAVGGVATAVTYNRGEPPAIWGTLAYFTLMEALQGAGYPVANECGSTANQTITVLSYLHIALQPLVINAFAMAIAPAAVSPGVRKWVWGITALASLLMLLRLVPIEAVGPCAPGDVMCGITWCLQSGDWHIGWQVPLNGLPAFLNIPIQFPSYMLAVFLLPLFYGAWRFVVFHAAVGPILAASLTNDPNEMPAIWCLFSIGIVVISISPFVRYRVMKAHRPMRAA